MFLLLLIVVSEALSCPISPNHTELHDIFQMYEQFLGKVNERDEHILSSIPEDIVPLSVPLKLIGSWIRFPVINNQKFCNRQYITFAPQTYISHVDCTFIEGLCHCEVFATSSSEFVAISPSTLKIEFMSQICMVWRNRHLEESQSPSSANITLVNNFDIGVVTHSILVILSLIAFAGNSLFVVYVFWLSR